MVADLLDKELMMLRFAILFVFVALTTSWIVLGVLAIARVRLRRARTSTPAPAEPKPITVLKPLCGADAGLESNLATFFAQDYPSFELVFGVERADDPAIAVVEKLRALHPHVKTKLIVHRGSRATNPKVSNLRAMVPHAAHDLLLISDSNVRAPRSYLAELAAAVEGKGVGLVTNIFTGTGEKSFGAALENVQLGGFVAAGSAIPTMFGDAAVVGKSMFFSKSVFERLGGFEAVSDVLAEDFIMGKMFQHGGYRVVIGRTILESVNGVVPFSRFLDRQLRWSMMRVRLRPFAFVLEPLASPLVSLPFAVALFGAAGGIAWAASMLLLRDVAQWIMLRGAGGVHLPLLLGAIREVAAIAVWIATPFVKKISWRGHRVRIGAGTHVFVPDPAKA